MFYWLVPFWLKDMRMRHNELPMVLWSSAVLVYRVGTDNCPILQCISVI